MSSNRMLVPAKSRIPAIVGAWLMVFTPATAQAAQIPPPGVSVLEGAEREKALDDVEDYLNAIDTLSGRFLQIGPDGRPAEGRFYMRKPLRARFEYAPPSELLVVADGSWVALVDGEIDQVDRVPISATPLDVILRDDLDVRADADPRTVVRDGDYLVVNVRQKEAETDGDLTLIFAQPALELREWIVRDAAGRPTSVSFSETVVGRRIDPALFRIEDDIEEDDFFDDGDK